MRKKSAIKNKSWTLHELSINNHMIPFLEKEKYQVLHLNNNRLLILHKGQDGTGIRTIRIFYILLNSSLKNSVKYHMNGISRDAFSQTGHQRPFP